MMLGTIAHPYNILSTTVHSDNIIIIAKALFTNQLLNLYISDNICGSPCMDVIHKSLRTDVPQYYFYGIGCWLCYSYFR